MENYLKDISKKLNVIVSLMLDKENSSTEIEKILKLNKFGLENIEIAQILNKTPGQVSDQIYNAKRKSKKKNYKKKE